MNHKNSLLFITAIAVQSSCPIANTADVSTDNPNRFAQQINEKLRKDEILNYQSLCDHLKNSFPSSKEAVQFLNNAEQAGPQTKELRQEILKLSLCFDDIEVNERLLYDENNNIIQDIYEKDNAPLLKTNFEKQTEIKKNNTDPKGHSLEEQIQRYQNEVERLDRLKKIRKNCKNGANNEVKYTLDTESSEIDKKIEAVKQKITTLKIKKEKSIIRQQRFFGAFLGTVITRSLFVGVPLGAIFFPIVMRKLE